MVAKGVPSRLSGTRPHHSFFLREDTLNIARETLGRLLVLPTETGERVSGKIVEVEAYCGITDRAAHSYGGRRTERNEVTYGAGGHAYVFFVYGMYYQLNVVLGPVDHPHVLLVRAVEPVEGIEIMRERRQNRLRKRAATSHSRELSEQDLTSGPGKLCIALGIDRSFNGEDLVEGERIWIEDHESFSEEEIAVGKRIGIDYAGEDADLPWRFWVRGNPYVSKPRVPID